MSWLYWHYVTYKKCDLWLDRCPDAHSSGLGDSPYTPSVVMNLYQCYMDEVLLGLLVCCHLVVIGCLGLL